MISARRAAVDRSKKEGAACDFINAAPEGMFGFAPGTVELSLVLITGKYSVTFHGEVLGKGKISLPANMLRILQAARPSNTLHPRQLNFSINQ
jgi:hypothetical protein